MTRQETVVILTLLAGNYESFAKRTETDEQVKIMLDTWQECLGDLDYRLVLEAVKKSIITSPYPPTIHEIRKNAVELINPQQENVLESWDECYKMICKGSYMEQEEFDKHSEVCKKFLGSINQLRNYARSDIDVINTVVKGQFMKQFEAINKREQEQKMLPPQMQNYTKQLTEKMGIKQLGVKDD